MGRLVERFWDDQRLASRPSVVGDDESQVFGAFVPHKIAQWIPVLDDRASQRVLEAEAEVRALEADHEGKAALPAEWLLRRAESAASSTIEGIRPSARRLARAEAQLDLFEDRPKSADLEALRNISATDHALEIAAKGRPITLDDICAAHRTLMGDGPMAGQLRDAQNWIGAGHFSTPLNAVHVPPPPEEVPDLMDDLAACGNRPGVNPIIQAALVHAQFETIHPFADGNGRTGRALIHLMLRHGGLTKVCTPPISSALALRRDDYLRALNETRVVCNETALERSATMSRWVWLLADATSEAAVLARRVIDHVSAVQDEWKERAAAHGTRKSSAPMRLIDELPAHPVLNAKKAADLLGADMRTALRCLRLLTECRILVQRSAGKRNRVYEAQDIVEAFTALAMARAGDQGIPLPADTPANP